MIIRFNKAQLGRNMETKLNSLLDEFQKGTGAEIEVVAVDFPYKFHVVVGDDVSVLVWDAESGEFKFVGVPVDSAETETIPESKKDTVDIPAESQDTQAVIIPADLAQRMYEVSQEYSRLSPNQLIIYQKALAERMLKDV